MELRQLRYFLRVVELGSMGKAAQDLGIVTSALSQQISRLEGELSVRLLQRTSTGVVPTAAGLAFRQEAQLALRHTDNAVLAAQAARLSGQVTVGLAPTTGSVLAVPFLTAMKQRYPDVRVHLIESLSGNLSQMLNRRQIDLGVVFHTAGHHSWSAQAILDERLFLIIHPNQRHLLPVEHSLTLGDITNLPLVMPSASHGLRALLNAEFFREGTEANVVVEIDGLALLMDVVCSGYAATVQPGAAVVRNHNQRLVSLPLAHETLKRRNLIASLSDEELAPAGLAARIVLADVMRSLVQQSRWPGATLL